MSAIDGTIRPETHVAQVSEAPRRCNVGKNRRASLLRMAWWTVPLHVALAFGFWWMMWHQPDQLAAAFCWIHLGFPLLLLASVRWWWDRWGELLALLAINHAVTFGVLMFLPMR